MDFVRGGFCPRGNFVQEDFVQGDFVQGDFVQGDFCPGDLSEGFCPGGFCPDTESELMFANTKVHRLVRILETS